MRRRSKRRDVKEDKTFVKKRATKQEENGSTAKKSRQNKTMMHTAGIKQLKGERRKWAHSKWPVNEKKKASMWRVFDGQGVNDIVKALENVMITPPK